MTLKEQIFYFIISEGFEPDLEGLRGNEADTPEHFHMNHFKHHIDVRGTFNDTSEFLKGKWANYYLILRLIGRKHIEEEVEVLYTKYEEGLENEFFTFEEIKEKIQNYLRQWIS